MATAPQTADPTRNATSPRTPRIVFFGPPYSGKSALLNVFIRTMKPDEFTVTLTATQPTNRVGREIVPHDIPVENPDVGAPGSTFTLYDCDGKAAGDLLTSPEAVIRRTSRGAIVEEVRNADALILIIDAYASDIVVNQTLQNFQGFVKGLQQGRTDGREVGGLPVFLTLTKCDALYQPGDTPTDWLQRVTERESTVQHQFEEYFGDDVSTAVESQFLSFGSIDLSLHATSIQIPTSPAFKGYADPNGTFGVADLVTECLLAARNHLDRVQSARKRLRWTVGGAAGLLALMMFGVLLFATTGGFGSSNLLAERVKAYQASEPAIAVRFSDKHFGRYYKELNSIHTSSGFADLSDDFQQFVTTRLVEFEKYKDYRSRFKPPRLGPAELRSREQVDQLALDLNDTLAPPSEFAATWNETEAVQLWAKWKTDLVLAREAEERVHDWYRGLIRRANELLLTDKPPDFGWRSLSVTLLADAESPPFRTADEMEKSPTVPVLRGRKLTYAVGFSFERVSIARRDWEDTRDRLRCLRDLTDAIGLTTGPGTPAPVLDLPEPTPDGIGSQELASVRLAALLASFPSRTKEGVATSLAKSCFPEWLESGYPDAVRQAVDLRLRSILETARRQVRRIILAQLGGNAESREGWKRLGNELLTPPPMRDWDKLLGLLQELSEREAAPSPLTELRAFLLQERYDLTMPSIVVTLPDDLLEQKATPSGNFILTVQPIGQQPTSYNFKRLGEGQRNRPYTSYTFQPDGHSGKITLMPGDGLIASVPLRSDGQDYRLVWASGRSNWFQLDRLQQPPRLEKIGPVPAPQPAPNVKLSVPEPGVFPRVPALLPDMRAR